MSWALDLSPISQSIIDGGMLFRLNHQEAAPIKLIPFKGDSLDQLWFLPWETSQETTQDVQLSVLVMSVESAEHIYKVLSFDLMFEDTLFLIIWFVGTSVQVYLLFHAPVKLIMIMPYLFQIIMQLQQLMAVVGVMVVVGVVEVVEVVVVVVVVWSLEVVEEIQVDDHINISQSIIF